MALLFYVRLIALTAGTLVYLFLLALILGHRRPRLFERLLFFLVLSLFAIYAGGLLEINAEIQYASPPETTRLLYASLTVLGLLFLPALLIHVHIQYCVLVARGQVPSRIKRIAVISPWYVIPFVIPLARISWSLEAPYSRFDLSLPFLLRVFRPEDAVLLIAAILCCVCCDFYFGKSAQAPTERRFFWWLGAFSFLLLIPLALREGFATIAPIHTDGMATAIFFCGVLPGTLLIYFALKHNFLEYGAQRNLVYALSATVLALLYLALVHRVSGWLAPVFPPEATASVLLFVLIFLFEPLERVIGPALHRRFQRADGSYAEPDGGFAAGGAPRRSGAIDCARRGAHSRGIRACGGAHINSARCVAEDAGISGRAGPRGAHSFAAKIARRLGCSKPLRLARILPARRPRDWSFSPSNCRRWRTSAA